MKYINNTDKDYIYSKFISRFIPNDKAYDMSTGYDCGKMYTELRAYIENLDDTDHYIISAKAFSFVLSHTPVNVSEYDYFPGIESINMPVKILSSFWMNQVLNEKISQVKSDIERLQKNGAALLYLDDCHSVPNYDYILPLGFPGMLSKVRIAKREHEPLTEKQEAFYTSMEIELEAILSLIDRFIDYAKAHPTKKSAKIIKCLSSLKSGEPKTFYEALMFLYLYFIVSEHINGIQVRSIGNFDRLLYPFYQRDIENGIATQAEQMGYIAYFITQFAAINNEFCQPVYFGGAKGNGESEINQLSYDFLEVWDSLGIMSPKIQIKYDKNTPENYLRLALKAIRHGHNSIVFVNDDIIRKTLVEYGVSEESARLANIAGCYEYSPAEGVENLGAFVNIAKAIEYTFFNGRDVENGDFIGLSLGDVEEFDTFEKFYNAVLQYSKFIVDETIKTVDTWTKYESEISPAVLFSTTRKSGLKAGMDAYCLAADEGLFNGLDLGCLGTVADSLAMIKKYVYDNKTVSLAEMKRMLRENFENDEIFRQKLLHDSDQFGNNRNLPDTIGKELYETLADYINHRPNGRNNGQWCTGLHISHRFLQWRDVTCAMPNGRLREEELSKNASPTQGSATTGPTAVLLSLTKLDATKFKSDFPLDVSVNPATIQGDEGIEALLSLLKAYRLKGGYSIHFNCIDSETLQDAIEHPEKHRDLQIRVCGWNVRFTTLERREQESYVKSARGAEC